VEEVATLAARLGWSYDTLMAMTTAERRLWLAASDRLAPVPGSVGYAAGVATTATLPPAGLETRPTAPSAPGRLSTEDERRARLVELLEEMTARRRRP